MSSKNFYWASFYASQGWPVAPAYWLKDGVCQCGKREACQSPGKHPIGSVAPSGVKDATTDEIRITGWWGSFPEANILIATGAASGIDVLDVDADAGGLDALAVLEKLHGFIPPTVRVETGGGGVHYYFIHRGGVTNSAGALPAGIHVRGDGGYVIAPPSNHVSGKRYAFAADCSPDEMDVTEWPSWTIEHIFAAPNGSSRPAPASAPAHERIGQGSRNTVLMSLAGTMRRRGMDAEEIAVALLAINQRRCVPPLEEQEVRSIATSAARYAPQPALAELRERYLTVPSTHPTEDIIRLCAQLQLTDMGNAQRLCAYHRKDLHYCDELGGWMTWTGTHWRQNINEAITRGKDTIMRIFQEAEVAGDDERAKALLSHAGKSQGRRRIVDMLALAQSEPEIPAHSSEFDQHDFLFNCYNGTYDLSTDTFRPHRREDLKTQMSGAVYDPTATCPRWISFLDLIFDGDQDLIRFVQQASGYALTGSTREQVIFILYGSGSNGKSTLIETLAYVLGDYAQTAQAKTFLADGSEGVRNDLAMLKTTRFVAASESGSGKSLDEGLIKSLSGDDRISARFLYHDYFHYYPKFKIFFATNHKPTIRGTDHGIWRRIRLIPFTVAIPEGQRDKGFKDLLRQEASGILNWMVNGYRDWAKNELSKPAAVMEATREYQEEQDQLARFLEECCALHPVGQTAKTDLFRAYERWCEQNNERPFSHNNFSRRLHEKGLQDKIVKTPHSTMRVWVGVALTVALGLPHWQEN